MRLLHRLINFFLTRYTFDDRGSADAGGDSGGDGGSGGDAGGGDGGGGDAGSGDGDGSGDGGDGDGDEPLGDEGKKALDIWKDRARAAEKEAKRAKALEAELDEIKKAGQTEQEKVLEQAREEAAAAARKELEGELHAERKRTAILSAASGRVRDPEDAVMVLIDKIELDDDGKPDPKAVKSAIDDLLESKPHWKADDRRNGDGDQGGRGGSGSKPTNLEEAVNQRYSRQS